MDEVEGSWRGKGSKASLRVGASFGETARRADEPGHAAGTAGGATDNEWA